MSGDDQARRGRLARLGELAAEQEDRARARFHEVDRQVADVDRRRADALQGAAGLAGERLSLAMRGHLAGVGARHLVALAGQRADLSGELDLRRADLVDAVGRVRSFERLVSRLDRSIAERQRRRELADLQDLVAIRAARERR